MGTIVKLFPLLALGNFALAFVSRFTQTNYHPLQQGASAQWALPDALDLSQAASTMSTYAGGSSVSPDMLPVFGGAIAAVVFGGVAVIAGPKLASGNAKDTTIRQTSIPPEPVKIDVSIPYDAAAMLAYREKLGISASDALNMDEFAEFKVMHDEAAVAQVIAKKKQRELEALLDHAQTKNAELDSWVAARMETQ